MVNRVRREETDAPDRDSEASWDANSGESRTPVAPPGPQPRDTYGLPSVLNVAQAAEFLGVDDKTIYAALNAGRMPGRRLNKRRWVILRDALLEWLRSQEHVPPSEDDQ